MTGKNTMKKLLIIISMIFLGGYSLVYATGEKYPRWSFQFYNDSIMTALEKVVFKTGVQINLNATIDDIYITNKFNDMTVHDILSAIFRRLNCGVVWNYSKEQLTSVDVWIYDRIQGNDFSNVPLNRFLKMKHLGSKKKDTNNHKSISHSVSQKFVSTHTNENKTNPATIFVNDVRSKHYEAPPMPPAFFHQEINNKVFQGQKEIVSEKTHSANIDKSSPLEPSNSEPHASLMQTNEIPAQKKDSNVNNQKFVIPSIEKPPPVPPGFSQE